MSFEPLISRGQEASAKPHLMDWRFLPEPVLLAKDALRSGIMFAGRNALPASWRARLWAHTFGAWAIQAIDRAGILYVHIPKTGGTSVSNILYGRNLPHFTASFYQLALGPRFSSLTRFATIRHPTKRLLSAWNFLRAGGSASIAADRWHWSKISKPRSFEDFVELIVDRRDLRDRHCQSKCTCQ